MKRPAVILIIAVAVAALLACVWIAALQPRDEVEWHKRAWHEAVNEYAGRNALGPVRRTMWAEVKRAIGRDRPAYQRMRDHEQALFTLGYLKTHDLLLTNQVLSRETRSNFVRAVMQQFGTNGECVWALQGLSNGYHAMLPAQDVAEWERLFREHAAAGASNAASSSSTASPP